MKGRQGILEVHTRDKPLEEVDLGLVAQQTSGLTGADLANICNEAAIFATRRGSQAIGMMDFDAALERVIAGSNRVAFSTSMRSGSSHTTRPGTRCAASCCRPSTGSIGSRSFRAGARSATRSTCPRRTAI